MYNTLGTRSISTKPYIVKQHTTLYRRTHTDSVVLTCKDSRITRGGDGAKKLVIHPGNKDLKKLAFVRVQLDFGGVLKIKLNTLESMLLMQGTPQNHYNDKIYNPLTITITRPVHYHFYLHQRLFL